ncbi:MAG: DUF4838 domain-containing protein [Phycisphaerae bacterium]|nr:DUF4838 domain-containing protein [Phycisphaerae bacterium]
MTSRRRFLWACLSGAAWSTLPTPSTRAQSFPKSPLATRGVVLVPEDFTLADWPERAKNAGLTTIALHHQHSPQIVAQWVRTDAGRQVLEQCRKLDLQVEYELHAMKELLPRNLFAKEPNLFRMNEKGQRTPDANCCTHARQGLDIIAENALTIAKTLQPTTGRYFYWGDDGLPWCLCPHCRELSPTDQAVVVENRICKALRTVNPKAQLAHLAYDNTLSPPTKIRPDQGLFLEYAPIHRRYDIPYEKQDARQADGLPALDANLKVFPKETAQVLEYWLDVSLFSKWKRPAVRLPWSREVFAADVAAYRKRGIRHVTTFAVWIDADYLRRFGNPNFIVEYGQGLTAM